jgi:glutamate 5-kinase
MLRSKVVIKFGSSSLTKADGHIDQRKIAAYVEKIAQLVAHGYAPVIVSSGAVAAGYARIGYKRRPRLLPQKQASAAVGQAILMQIYQELFSQHQLVVGQLLLTRMDLTDKTRCYNAFNTLDELLQQGVIPIINENDSVSVNELKFSDNDLLSAYVANLAKAKDLLIMTDTDGLYSADPRKDPSARRFDKVTEISEELMSIAGGTASEVGTGGMRSKVEAARIALFGGISVYIGKLKEHDSLLNILSGQGDGTYFIPSVAPLSVKKQWLGLHSYIQGRIVIDAGASKAILEQGRSLLPAGIMDVEGEFHAGDVVEVVDEQKKPLGRGIANYNEWEIRAVKGLSSTEVLKRIQVEKIEVIHRDEWMSYLGKGVLNHEH